MKYLLIVLLLTWITLISSESITIPAAGAVGKCSSSATTKATFYATIPSPGVRGVYLVPKDDYDSLISATQQPQLTNVTFSYYVQFSCASGNVTSCQKNTGSTVLPSAVVCVVIVNEVNSTLTGNLNVDFTNANPLASSGVHVVVDRVWWLTLAVLAVVWSV